MATKNIKKKTKKLDKVTDLPSSIYALGSNKKNTKVRALVYGRNGSGKTPFLGTANERMLILDSDGGFISAEASGSKAHVWHTPDESSLIEAYEFLKNEKHDYKWFSWDTITQWQERTLIDDILADAILANPNSKQSPDVASQREYLILQTRTMRHVRNFASLPLNFILTAHEMTAENDEGEVTYVPAIRGGGNKTPPLWSTVSGYMNVIGYMHPVEKEKNEKKVQVNRLDFRDKQLFLARDRTLSLGKFIDTPTITKIEELLADRSSSKVKKGTK